MPQLATAAPSPAAATPPPAAATPPPAAATPPPQVSSEQVKQALERIKAAIASTAQGLEFSMDQGSGRTVITVVDTATKEVIRQIPSEEVLQMSKELDKMQGLLLNRKA